MAEDSSSGTDSGSGGSGSGTGSGSGGSGTDSSSSGSGGGGTSSESGDYDQLDWKDIMRYVTGFDPDKPAVDGSAISDPQTIQDAADAFWYTQTLLEDAAKNLGAQVAALTGPDGPWQGAAARALNDVMTTLAKQTQDMADTLSGGITGDHNVPQQLANDAATLKFAIMTLEDIDSYYAMKALEWAHDHLQDITMDDGRVAVSQAHTNPPITDLLDDDMRAVMRTLADHYRVTIDNVAYSTPPTNPVNGSGGPGPTAYGGPGDVGGYGGPPGPYPDMGSGGAGDASSGASNAAAGYLPPDGTQAVGGGGVAWGGDGAPSGPGPVPPTGQSDPSGDMSPLRVLHKVGDGSSQDTGNDPQTYRTLVKGHADAATSDPDDGYRTLRRERVGPLTVDKGPGPADDGYRTLRREQAEPLTVDKGPGPVVHEDQKEPAGLPGF